MNKTPDEIKKGLEKCSACGSVCDGCEFSNGNAEKWQKLMGYALAYIQQLEAELEKEKDLRAHFAELSWEYKKELAQMKRERDALQDGFKKELGCSVCKHFDDDAEYVSNECIGCGKNKCNWEYRGLCEKMEV